VNGEPIAATKESIVVAGGFQWSDLKLPHLL